MIRCWISATVFAVALALPTKSEAQAAANDDVRREVTALAERVERLEAENAALKERNDSLERRVAELEPPQHAAASAPATAPMEPAPEPAPSVESWQERFDLSGYVFGDAYAVLANHDPEVEDQTGFWIRRGYLTFDAKVANEWTARLRLEFNSPGDFESDSKLDPFVKDAYLAWKHDGQELYLGLAPSPTFEFVEGFWGHRPIEKTPIDLYRMGSSRDTGVAYKGAAYEGRVFYHAMFGNGSGDRAETNEGKKVMAGLGFGPPTRWWRRSTRTTKTGRAKRTAAHCRLSQAGRARAVATDSSTRFRTVRSRRRPMRTSPSLRHSVSGS